MERSWNTPDIPAWSLQLIEEGLVKDKFLSREPDKERKMTSKEVRTALVALRLESLRDFFRTSSQEHKKLITAYDISMYQTALLQLGDSVIIDGIYRDSRSNVSHTALLIAAFQKKYRIMPEDGLPGKNTAAKIAEALDTKIKNLNQSSHSDKWLLKWGAKALPNVPSQQGWKTERLSNPSESPQATIPLQPTPSASAPSIVPKLSWSLDDATIARGIGYTPPWVFRWFWDGITGEWRKK